MCYVRKTAEEVRQSRRGSLSMERWLQIAEEARKQGMLYLLLTGGEPLMWPGFWQLYEMLIHMGFLVSINTNGSLIDEEAVEHFRQLPPTRVNITLYGASNETYLSLCGVKGMFDKVDRAIRMLKRNEIPVKLNGSVTPINAQDMEACARYAESLELIYEPVTYMFPPIRRDETMVGQNERFTPEEAAHYELKGYLLQFGEKYYRQYLEGIRSGVIPPPGLDEHCIDPIDGKIRCRAGKASFWITWDGYMTPCGMMTEPKVDLLEQDFNSAWKELTKICEELRLSGTCESCSNSKVCHSCAAMALAETGSVSGIPRYLCEKVAAMKAYAEKELAYREQTIDQKKM